MEVRVGGKERFGWITWDRGKRDWGKNRRRQLWGGFHAICKIGGALSGVHVADAVQSGIMRTRSPVQLPYRAKKRTAVLRGAAGGVGFELAREGGDALAR